MRVKAMYVLTAMLDDNTHMMFEYEDDVVYTHDNGSENSMQTALARFWHDDYPELVDEDFFEERDDCFPIRVQCSPDSDGWMESETTVNFNPAVWHHYFDKGWSASSKEPGQRYTWEQFLKDIEVKPEAKKAWVFVGDEATNGDVEDSIVHVFDTEDKARKYWDDFVSGKDGIAEFSASKGWTIDLWDADSFRAGEDGDYANNHTEAAIYEREVEH